MKLEAYLNRKHLTASAFAALIQVPPSTITRILNKQRTPSLGILERIYWITDGRVKPQDFFEEQV
jgi:transcriptional regulator with XRE-family HTH domain